MRFEGDFVREQLHGIQLMESWFHQDEIASSVAFYKALHPGKGEKMLEINDIVKNGLDAEKYLAKYPYSSVHEKKLHKTTAAIGKLAERGYIDIVKPISDEEWNALCDEVENDAKRIRRNGEY